MASYKAEAKKLRTENELKRQANEVLERQIRDFQEKARKCEEEKKKRWSCIVYCTNCLEVNSVSIPPGVKVSEGDCVTCRVRGTQLLVRKTNNC